MVWTSVERYLFIYHQQLFKRHLVTVHYGPIGLRHFLLPCALRRPDHPLPMRARIRYSVVQLRWPVLLGQPCSRLTRVDCERAMRGERRLDY